MTETREHKITLKKSPSETIVSATCNECEMEMADPSDYHPPAFCVLIKAGHNPFNLVRAAASKIPKTGVIELQEVRDASQ